MSLGPSWSLRGFASNDKVWYGKEYHYIHYKGSNNINCKTIRHVML